MHVQTMLGVMHMQTLMLIFLQDTTADCRPALCKASDSLLYSSTDGPVTQQTWLNAALS